MSDDSLGELRRRIARRHHLAGWGGLLVFLALGLALEALHGFKAGAYLDPDQRVRRLMWTLAHAHGTLFALIQIAFAAGLAHLGGWTAGRLKLASFLLLDGLVLLPLGFFLGGFGHGEGDPGIGVLLVPAGGLLMLGGVGLAALAAVRPPAA